MKDLSAFFSEVGKHDLLTKEQEVELSQLIEKGDKAARDRMISSNLRLAISIAKKYQYSGCSLEDLIQESTMGLIKAVDRFDWRRGHKFSTYACWWIKQAVRRHIASHSAAIKLPTHARGLLWKMRVLKEEFEEEFGREPTQDEIADMLGVKKQTLNALIKSSRFTLSLDAKVGRADDGGGRTLAEVIPEDKEHLDDLLDRDKLIHLVRNALSGLSSREEKVLRLRFGLSEESNNHDKFPITEKQIKKLKERSK
jgi:RNA polymerase primary sigma factor